MSGMGHEQSFTMAQILADERPLTDVNRSLDQVYLNAATLNVSSYQQQSLDTACLEGQQSAYSVEKLRSRTTRKLAEYFCSPDAHIRAASSATETLQDESSTANYVPFVTTVRNWPQNANEIVSLFKTEFFNRIGHKRTCASCLL